MRRPRWVCEMLWQS